jgi:class 3 adenylate cyclase
MALFGAPIAHEDHAARAVAAALAIQKKMAAYAADLRRGRGLEFGLRIGLNTGPVVVGTIGDDLRMDYTAQGETVNLAARLQQIGDPGAVLSSEATARLVRRAFVTEDRGEVALKGIDHPVRVYAVTGERRRQSRFDALLERGLTPLVGRERELSFLEDCLARAREGRGQVVSLVGDAGVGKSRLAY